MDVLRFILPLIKWWSCINLNKWNSEALIATFSVVTVIAPVLEME